MTDAPSVAFKDVEFALLVGARPRSKGMERGDLLTENGKIFKPQGEALNNHAKRNVKVLVVGNPANTNALIAMRNAPDLDPRQFTAMTRLDHNRAMSQLAEKTGAAVTDIERVAIWGNHSATQYPDLSHATVKGAAATSVVEESWIRNDFIPRVQKRGAEVIEARGLSSAASAGYAGHLCDQAVCRKQPVLRILYVQRIVIKRGHPTDDTDQHPHGVGIVTIPGQHAPNAFVNHRVLLDLRLEVAPLPRAGQLAEQKQVTHLQIAAVLREMVDGIAPMQQDAFVTVDEGDAAGAAGCHPEPGIVREVTRRDV